MINTLLNVLIKIKIIILPIVILDGIQCGLIVKSGDIPVKVNGKSSYR